MPQYWIHVACPGHCYGWPHAAQLWGLILGRDQNFIFATTFRLGLGAQRTFMTNTPEIEGEDHLVWRLTRHKTLHHVLCHTVMHRHKDIVFKIDFVLWIVFWWSHIFSKECVGNVELIYVDVWLFFRLILTLHFSDLI